LFQRFNLYLCTFLCLLFLTEALFFYLFKNFLKSMRIILYLLSLKLVKCNFLSIFR